MKGMAKGGELVATTVKLLREDNSVYNYVCWPLKYLDNY